MNLLRFWRGVFFPEKCVLCGGLLEKEGTDLCETCKSDTKSYRKCKYAPHFLDSVLAVWYYEGNVRRSLLRFKFYGARRYGAAYGRCLAARLSQEPELGFDLITWIPISPLRKLCRGYDQGAILAKAVGKALKTKPVPLLRKTRHNRAQSSLRDYSARKANVLGVYRVKNPALLTGKRILLLDDIFTTGATASEAARVLRTAGAKEVHCAVIAAARKE